VPRTRDQAARKRVLDAARELITSRGPRAATIDEIAAAAHVGKQTIYRWWPSKSAVVMDALADLTDPEPADLPDSTYEAIRLQMHRVAKMFRSRQGQLIREVAADSQADPVLANDFRQRFFAHRRARAAATLIRGVDLGDLRPDLDIDNALDVLYAPLWLRLLVGHAPLTPRTIDGLLAFVWPSIANPTAGARKPPSKRRATTGR
jgi:AcrR family transcriptional regulator